MHGSNRLGGNSLSDLLVFGKRAGENAAAYVSKLSRRPQPAEVDVQAATDEALVSRAALGDNHAFDEITIRYQARVYRLACRLVGHDDAPDVMQEGFLSVYRNLASFRHESRFGTWLYRIVTNAALMHRRARTRRPVESLESFLPEFDTTGRHRQSPAELQVAARRCRMARASTIGSEKDARRPTRL